jgi:two-component system response regulator AtoC
VARLLLFSAARFPLEGESILATEKGTGDRPIGMVVGASASIRVLQRVLAEIAPTDFPVLILGESGTGKEVIASEIHRLSGRCGGPFLKFNCSSMNLEWLFGVPERDPSNGKTAGKDGTVLLDKISDLDLGKQTRLLDLLPDGNQASSEHCLTSRIISTSTKDLAEEMRSGNFREELYFRLSGICLRIPSLRQRKEDIPLLFTAFLAKYAKLLGRQQPQIKSSSMDLLIRHSWPGNVRELDNVARNVVVLGDDELGVSDLALSLDPGAPDGSSSHGTHANPRSLKQAAREASAKVERQLILETLERTHWNRKRSARELQISYKALLYKLKQLELADEDKLRTD